MAIPRLNIFLLIQILSLFILGPKLSAQLSDKTVTIQAHNKSLAYIFNEISLQTGYLFTYNSGIIDKKVHKTIKIEGLSIEEALDSILQQPELAYVLIDKNIVIYKESKPPDISAKSKNTIITITGKVVDIKNKNPLEFASITLNNSNKGTLSNLQGEFRFSIPADIENPVLVVSMMGYDNLLYAINMESAKDLELMMTPRIISLQEVIIRYHNPELILNECIKRIPENYISQSFFMEAYFREFTLKDKEIMTFSEATLEIDKPSYANHIAQDKVRIVKGRKISNVNKGDSILIKIKSGIYSALELDIIRNPIDFLLTDFSRYYDLHFADIISYKDKLVYVIQFKQKQSINEVHFQGQLYIDINEMALLAADFEINPSLIGKESSMFFVKKNRNLKGRPLYAKYHIEYRKSEGKYHLNMAHGEVAFKFRKKSKWVSNVHKIVIELAVTDIDLEKDLSISRKELLKQGVILSDEFFPADPLFWSEYNIIVPEKELEEAVMRMGENWGMIGDGG
ncbi:MAG: carboxypeptidase-like regulatory domain-containing protein [Bacteroidales bacterium]|nr:carboxypeptidase-like regulatory domain-containing protein [Bacteroidales bacterium]